MKKVMIFVLLVVCMVGLMGVVSAKTPEYRFAQVTDSHIVYNQSPAPSLKDGRTDVCHYFEDIGDYNATYCSQGWSIAPQIALNSTVDLINSNYSDINFTIITGDLIAQEEYTSNKITAMEILVSIKDRLVDDFYYVMAGFHDVGDDIDSPDENIAMYESNLSQSVNHNFTSGDNLFIITSEQSGRDYNYTFLNDTLQAYKNQGYKVFLFGHEAPVDGLRTNTQIEYTDIIEGLKDNFTSFMFFGGHNHVNRLYVQEGIPYFTLIPSMSVQGRIRLVDIYDDHIHTYLSPELINESISNLSRAYIEEAYTGSGVAAVKNGYEYYYQNVPSDDYSLDTGGADEDYYIPLRFIDSCQTLTEEDGYYALNASINATGIASCIVISNHSITLDLNGYNISGDTSVSSSLISSIGYDNLTIKNGNLSGGKTTTAFTLLIQNGENIIIENMSFNQIAKAKFEDLLNLNVKDVSFNGSRSTGALGFSVVIADTQDSYFEGLTINNSADEGIRIAGTSENCYNITFKNIIIENSASEELKLSGANLVYDILFTNATFDRSDIIILTLAHNFTLKSIWDGRINTTVYNYIKDSEVSIYNSSGDLVSSLLSDYRGYLDEIYLTEAIYNGTQYIYPDNYTISITNTAGVDKTAPENVTYNLSSELKSLFDVLVLVQDIISPQVTINFPNETEYTDSSILFNVTLNENGTCLFSLDAGMTNTSMDSVDNQNFNYTNSSVSDGQYIVNYYCNDTAGNRNDTEAFSFIVDLTAPNITLVSPANDYSETSSLATINFQFNVSDVLSDINYCSVFVDGAESANTSAISETEVNNISISSIGAGSYSWKVYCNDTVGNDANSSSRDFTITAPATATATTGGGSPSYYPSSEDMTEGYTKVLGRGWKLKFDIGGDDHELKVDKIENETVTIIILSEPQNKTLSVGEEWKVNLDGDEDYDLLVRLENVSLFRAEVFLKSISEAVVEEVVVDEDVDDDVGDEVVGDVEDRGYVVWVVAGVLIFIVVLVLGWVKFGKKIRARRKRVGKKKVRKKRK